jgi:hypothetical protein
MNSLQRRSGGLNAYEAWWRGRQALKPVGDVQDRDSGQRGVSNKGEMKRNWRPLMHSRRPPELLCSPSHGACSFPFMQGTRHPGLRLGCITPSWSDNSATLSWPHGTKGMPVNQSTDNVNRCHSESTFATAARQPVVSNHDAPPFLYFEEAQCFFRAKLPRNQRNRNRFCQCSLARKEVYKCKYNKP